MNEKWRQEALRPFILQRYIESQFYASNRLLCVILREFFFTPVTKYTYMKCLFRRISSIIYKNGWCYIVRPTIVILYWNLKMRKKGVKRELSHSNTLYKIITQKIAYSYENRNVYSKNEIFSILRNIIMIMVWKNIASIKKSWVSQSALISCVSLEIIKYLYTNHTHIYNTLYLVIDLKMNKKNVESKE